MIGSSVRRPGVRIAQPIGGVGVDGGSGSSGGVGPTSEAKLLSGTPGDKGILAKYQMFNECLDFLDELRSILATMPLDDPARPQLEKEIAAWGKVVSGLFNSIRAEEAAGDHGQTPKPRPGEPWNKYPVSRRRAPSSQPIRPADRPVRG